MNSEEIKMSEQGPYTDPCPRSLPLEASTEVLSPSVPSSSPFFPHHFQTHVTRHHRKLLPSVLSISLSLQSPFTSGIMLEAHGERHFRIAVNLPPCPPPAPPSRSTHRESSTFSQSPKASPTTAK